MRAPDDPDTVLLAVNGTLMRGLARNPNHVNARAEFLYEATTSADYRLYSTGDEHPVMQRVDEGGAAIACEVWRVPDAGVASILAGEPAGLCIGKITLSDGQLVLGVLGEPLLCESGTDITAYGATVSRRQAGLALELGVSRTCVPRHVVIDTTGLKVFGAGEWYVRKHGMGRGRRRTWRKLHLGVDEATKEIAAVDLTTSGVHDGPHMPSMLDRVPDEVGQVSGDRAYDRGRCYQAILARGAVATIPPRRNARLSTAKDPPDFRLERDAVVRRIKEEGRYPWRTVSGATRQSLAENAVSRFKALVGVKLTARAFENQQVEAHVKCRVLNRMTALGLPISERVLLP